MFYIKLKIVLYNISKYIEALKAYTNRMSVAQIVCFNSKLGITPKIVSELFLLFLFRECHFIYQSYFTNKNLITICSKL